jgi:hypothetical protein
MIYCFDIDGTICTITHGAYDRAQPFLDRINVINLLYAQGHVVKLFTARGTTTGIDWREVTERQMCEWGVKYHELIMGKPEADLFIDDKAVSADQWNWIAN